MIFSSLQRSLDELGISKNRLAVESKIRPNTIYDIVDNQITLIKMVTLETILDTLNSIAIEKGINKKLNILPNKLVVYKILILFGE